MSHKTKLLIGALLIVGVAVYFYHKSDNKSTANS